MVSSFNLPPLSLCHEELREFVPGMKAHGGITAGSRKQKINSPHKSLAGREFFRSLALTEQEEIATIGKGAEGNRVRKSKRDKWGVGKKNEN